MGLRFFCNLGKSPPVISFLPFLLMNSISLYTSAPSHQVPFTELYPSLRSALLSHSHVLRLSALQILSSRLVSSSAGEQDTLRRCLQGEDASLDMNGVRDRILRIGRVGVAVKDDEHGAADLCGRWLIGKVTSLSQICGFRNNQLPSAQLKVNLRPLWSPATEALSALAKRLGDLTWALMFEELYHVATGDRTFLLPTWLKEKENVVRDQNTWEEERSWRDGAAHKVRQAVDEWLDDALERKAIILVSRPVPVRDHVVHSLRCVGAKAFGQVRSFIIRDSAVSSSRTVSLVGGETQPRGSIALSDFGRCFIFIDIAFPCHALYHPTRAEQACCMVSALRQVRQSSRFVRLRHPPFSFPCPSCPSGSYIATCSTPMCPHLQISGTCKMRRRPVASPRQYDVARRTCKRQCRCC